MRGKAGGQDYVSDTLFTNVRVIAVGQQIETKEGKKHKKLFSGTPEQMETLVNWLREQKKAP